jgi:acyl carrier protein
MADGLEQELFRMVAETCRVAEPLPADLSPDAPLIGPDSAFGLDSLDAVEIVVAVQRRYNVRIDAQETSRQVLQSLSTLAAFIRAHRPG